MIMVLRASVCHLLVCVILFSAAPLLRAQQNEGIDIRFRLAQSYDRSGDYQAAIRIYEEILKQQPINIVIIDALRRDYVELKMYNEAIALVERQLKIQPSDINLRCQLASIYYLRADTLKANEEWEHAISLNPKQPATYSQVANSFTQSRLFDRAIDTYRRGRKACENPSLFTQELAYLYGTLSKYEDATKEYVSFLRQNPIQLGFVQTQIGGYTNHPEALASARKVIEEASRSAPDDLPLLHLLAWIDMEGSRYDAAFDIYKAIDAKSKGTGHVLQTFAQRALHDKAFGIAAAAFREIIDHYPKFDKLAEVKFGYAQSLEASDESHDTLRLFGRDRPFSDQASDREDRSVIYSNTLDAYNRVIGEYPATEFAARSVFRIAVLQQEKFGDLTSARQSLENLLKSYPMFPQVVIEGALRLGDIYLLLGMIDKASAQYAVVAGRGLRTNPLQDQAMLKLAELEYFKMDFDTALVMLGGLIRNTNSDVANDAIALQTFIQENIQTDRSVLQVFAQADLLRRQRKYLDALALYQSIIQKYPKSGLVDDAAMRIGDIYTLLGRYTEAVASYEHMLTEYPESISLDRALMKIGEVYQSGLKDPARAIAAYQKLLEQFPSSIYLNEARKRIRQLRGDTI